MAKVTVVEGMKKVDSATILVDASSMKTLLQGLVPGWLDTAARRALHGGEHASVLDIKYVRGPKKVNIELEEDEAVLVREILDASTTDDARVTRLVDSLYPGLCEGLGAPTNRFHPINIIRNSEK